MTAIRTLLFQMCARPKFHGSSPYSSSENELNAKKMTILHKFKRITPTPTTTTEKKYICLASSLQAR